MTVPTSWLLDADPALRWQVERDLLELDESVWRATRARVATEGFGARLLALQDDDGRWAGGAFFPGGQAYFAVQRAEVDPPQPWTATTWSLNALREWGLDAAVLRALDTPGRLARGCRWEYDDLPYWGGEVDCCINAFTLANGAWLGVDVEPVLEHLLEVRRADGGWNCDWVDGATVSSVTSTLNVVSGLLDYEQRVGGDERAREARRTGQEYLLRRRLMYRLSTGELVGPWVLPAEYPYRGRYSVLRAADHVRRAAAYDGLAPDERLADAVEVVRAARREDGTWVRDRHHPGEEWFEVDVPAGEPSRWLTLAGTLLLRWWDGA
ncbi:squalene cyclase [Isoptericola sediminis]|uniref:Squalene cyclase n=1 Tax=Isoptericola sediminis TaxID=2733572 RepID=A0A849JUR8_9MICO|nr:squalene cyclase [Isoptericola sediminis]NNU26344.1 squalene cyclase [Isoptericola sediminis]